MTRETVTLDSTDVDREFTYDAVGNLLWRIDRLDRKTVYDYDNLYRMAAERWRNSGDTADLRTFQFDYDLAGQMTDAYERDGGPAAAIISAFLLGCDRCAGYPFRRGTSAS